jgi:hypothetical protein
MWLPARPELAAGLLYQVHPFSYILWCGGIAMKTIRHLLALSLVLMFSSVVLADAIQLDNGDTLNGKVVSVNDKEVTFQSEVHGKMILARKKVIAIVLGDAKLAPQKSAQGYQEGESPKDIVGRLVPKNFGVKQLRELEKGKQPAPNPEDLVDQLRTEGVDPALVNELKVRLPGFSAPPVQKYFNDTVQGLMSGKINLGHIRKDAVNARDQLNDLKKDLGPDGAVLDGYLSILNGFINETAPPSNKKPTVTKRRDETVKPSKK